MKYSILKTSNDKNVTFDWDSALSFEGDSAPYLQYCYARIHSIQNNIDSSDNLPVNYALLTETQELELILDIARFPDIIASASKSLSPHIVATYLFGLAQKFSKFYHSHSVLHADCEALKQARLHLVTAVKQVMYNCFYILGITPIEQM